MSRRVIAASVDLDDRNRDFKYRVTMTRRPGGTIATTVLSASGQSNAIQNAQLKEPMPTVASRDWLVGAVEALGSGIYGVTNLQVVTEPIERNE